MVKEVVVVAADQPAAVAPFARRDLEPSSPARFAFVSLSVFVGL